MNPILSGTALGWTRSPSYWSKDFLYPCPCDVVFQAQVASEPLQNTYFNIAYDTVTVGSYETVQIGQTVIISATPDHTDSLNIGRVAATATISTIPVNEDAYPLTVGLYITVIDEYRELPKVRAGNLIDGRKPYENVPPAIKNMRSAYHKWSATTAALSFSPVGQAMADGATIDPDEGYHWDFPAGVTFTTGDADSREIEIDAPHGHLWGRLTVTDSNDVSQWMVFQIFVDDPSSPTLALVSADKLSLTRNLTGHHCTFTAYKNVRTSELLDGTRMIVVSKPRYSSGDPDLDPVRFVGYLIKETNNTNGPNDKSVSFEMAGLWERAGQLPFNAIAIRSTASPTLWDEMVLPTTQRVIWHILTRYSVLPNLAAIDFDVTDDTWYGGDRNVSSNSLGDACEQALSEINATLIGNPSGEMFLRRWAYFLDDDEKDDLDTVATLGSSDLRNLSFPRMHDDPVGRVAMGWASYFTDGSEPKLGRGLAPSVTLGTSPEVREFNNQLMPADLTDLELLGDGTPGNPGAVAQRTAALLGVANIAYTLSGEARDGFAWMSPSVHQWVPVTLATGLTTRGRTMSNVRHLLVGVQIDYDNRAHTHTNKFELQPEPGPQSALVVANLTPSAQSLDQIITPVRATYPGLTQPSSLNSPDTTTKKTFHASNMGGIGSTLPADKQAEAADTAPKNGSRTVAIGFWVPDEVPAGFLTDPTSTYTFTVKGTTTKTRYQDCYDFSSADDGWDPAGGDASNAQRTNGHGWGQINNTYLTLWGPQDDREVQEITITFDRAWAGANDFDKFFITISNLDTGNAQSWGTGLNPLLFGGPSFTFTKTGAPWVNPRVQLAAGGFTFAPNVNNPTPQYIITICYNDVVVPLDVLTHKDAFYEWEEDEDGNAINVRLNPSGGYKIDGTVATTPLYSESHEYTFTKPGTGNQFELVFDDDDYDALERRPLVTQIDGPNAGT